MLSVDDRYLISVLGWIISSVSISVAVTMLDSRWKNTTSSTKFLRVALAGMIGGALLPIFVTSLELLAASLNNRSIELYFGLHTLYLPFDGIILGTLAGFVESFAPVE